MATKEIQAVKIDGESFESLFEQSIKEEKRENTVVRGVVVGITDSDVIVDVGLKSEGRIARREFVEDGGVFDLEIGSDVDVFIERLEDRYGSTQLSREKALKEEAWQQLERLHASDSVVEGKIIGSVRGGFAVAIGKIVAFLPGSQVDLNTVRDITPLLGVVQPFKIVKMADQGNIVVSRRAIFEAEREKAKDVLLAGIYEGMILDGFVKNITDYGAFINLGPIDGLLHITDIAWGKVSHPSEVLSIGQQIKVMVIKYNEETKRVSLGLKQLEENNWESLVDKYPAGMKVEGVVTTVTHNGANIELEPGVEGWVYQSDMSWHSRAVQPRQLLKKGDKVEAVILELDIAKHKLSLSMKACKPNPWLTFAERHPVGSEVDGVVATVVDFGMFVAIDSDEPENMVEALIQAVDLSWDEKPETELKKYKRGDIVRGVVLSIDFEKLRVTVGVKQLTTDQFTTAVSGLKFGDTITCTVTAVRKDGIEVELGDGISTFIKKSELSKHKSEQRPERYGVGDKIDAKVALLQPGERKLTLSIKALEVEEEKRVIDQYGSKDSGASLGEILGMAFSKEKAAEENKE